MTLEEKYARAVEGLRLIAARKNNHIDYSDDPTFEEGYHDGEYSCAVDAEDVLRSIGESIK